MLRAHAICSFLRGFSTTTALRAQSLPSSSSSSSSSSSRGRDNPATGRLRLRQCQRRRRHVPVRAIRDGGSVRRGQALEPPPPSSRLLPDEQDEQDDGDYGVSRQDDPGFCAPLRSRQLFACPFGLATELLTLSTESAMPAFTIAPCSSLGAVARALSAFSSPSRTLRSSSSAPPPRSIVWMIT